MRLANAAACATALALGACSSFVQTTSGEEYLARATAIGVDISDELKAAAGVEPILAFPARIGVARIEYGKLTDIPGDEWDALAAALDGEPAARNEYVPVSLFVTDLVAPREPDIGPGAMNRSDIRRDIIQRLQIGGARQHLDAILVYEVYGRSDTRRNDLAVADLTIIGAYLAPSRKATAEPHASALLFDVRNGYPYGAASATVERGQRAPAVYAGKRADDLLRETQGAAVADLAPKLADMMTELERDLARKRQG